MDDLAFKARSLEVPNNPLGSVWIGLPKPSYGIHGSPEPLLVRKSQSHVCIRVTNWDAQRLAVMVRKGVPVRVKNIHAIHRYFEDAIPSIGKATITASAVGRRSVGTFRTSRVALTMSVPGGRSEVVCRRPK